MNTVIRVTRRATIVKLLIEAGFPVSRSISIADIAVVTQRIEYSPKDEAYYLHWVGLSHDNLSHAMEFESNLDVINTVHSLQNCGIPVLLVQIPSFPEDVLLIEVSVEKMPIKVSSIRGLVSQECSTQK